jgi:antirestriction protein ArdC
VVLDDVPRDRSLHGHTKRLDRLARTHFGSGEYSREELVAEIGAAMLCGVSGITRQVEYRE